jgi:F-box/WD-40 domain protein 7
VGHFGSVSVVAAAGGGTAACGPAAAAGSDAGRLALSSGYDKTVRVWDVRTGGAADELKAHAAPVLSLAVNATGGGGGGMLAASGDRDGVAVVWDVAAGAALATLKGHRGHLTSLAWLDSSGGASAHAGTVLLTGAQDGRVRAWDLRSGACIANVAAHTSAAGSGAVGDICVCDLGGETLVVTAGADKAVCVLDPGAAFATRYRFEQHKDFIYSLHAASPLCLSGAGDGLLLAHDLATGKVVWGLGANAAAVRCIAAVGRQHLVAAGDDGKALVYDFY